MRHDIDWKKAHCKVGDQVPVYPYLRESFIGTVEKVKKNKYGRVSYVVSGKDVFAEELLPAKTQIKLRMRATT